jgi:fermentation-respiration switch protein FrsA (DUF1100 family)
MNCIHCSSSRAKRVRSPSTRSASTTAASTTKSVRVRRETSAARRTNSSASVATRKSHRSVARATFAMPVVYGQCTYTSRAALAALRVVGNRTSVRVLSERMPLAGAMEAAGIEPACSASRSPERDDHLAGASLAAGRSAVTANLGRACVHRRVFAQRLVEPVHDAPRYWKGLLSRAFRFLLSERPRAFRP